MMTKRVERAVIALAAALLVVLFGFSPKSAWAAGEGRARIGDTTYKTVQEAIDSVKPVRLPRSSCSTTFLARAR